MDNNIKRYLTAAVIVVIVVYAIAHIDVLREKVLGLPGLSA